MIERDEGNIAYKGRVVNWQNVADNKGNETMEAHNLEVDSDPDKFDPYGLEKSKMWEFHKQVEDEDENNDDSDHFEEVSIHESDEERHKEAMRREREKEEKIQYDKI
jgi:hypothetical protein